MPTINETPIDKDGKLIDMNDDSKTAKVTCGVQRKVNIGNFESIDVYCAASVPVELDDPTDVTELETKLIQAMENLISITSKETADKYKVIKGID